MLSSVKLDLNATDRRTCSKDKIFEILQILKSTRDRLVEVNDEKLEQCDNKFVNLLIAEEEWDHLGTRVITLCTTSTLHLFGITSAASFGYLATASGY